MELEFCSAPFGSPDYIKSLALRETVLRLPLGLKNRPEDVAYDHVQQHYVAKQEEVVVATLSMMRITETSAKLRQMAVAEHKQHAGIGQALVTYVHRMATMQGFVELALKARIEAVGFYEKLGYSRVGDLFEEIGITHQAMQIRLIAGFI